MSIFQFETRTILRNKRNLLTVSQNSYSSPDFWESRPLLVECSLLLDLHFRPVHKDKLYSRNENFYQQVNVTIISLGFTKSIAWRLIACIAALAAGRDPDDEVERAGDAVPLFSPLVVELFAAIGFLIIVTGAVGWFGSGPAATRLCRAALND